MGAHPEALSREPPAPHGWVQTATGRAPTGGGIGTEGGRRWKGKRRRTTQSRSLPKSALYAAARRGDLKTAMPKGCERLTLVKMEWFEEWIGVGE